MEDLEQHDRVAEVRRVGGILGVGKARPVDAAVGEGRDWRDVLAKGVGDVVVQADEFCRGGVEEEQDDQRDHAGGAQEAHALGSQDLADAGLERGAVWVVGGGEGCVGGEVEEGPGLV